MSGPNYEPDSLHWVEDADEPWVPFLMRWKLIGERSRLKHLGPCLHPDEVAALVREAETAGYTRGARDAQTDRAEAEREAELRGFEKAIKHLCVEYGENRMHQQSPIVALRAELARLRGDNA